MSPKLCDKLKPAMGQWEVRIRTLVVSWFCNDILMCNELCGVLETIVRKKKLETWVS